jgi:hypothetical protein
VAVAEEPLTRVVCSYRSYHNIQEDD